MENREVANLIVDHPKLFQTVHRQFNIYSPNRVGEILKWGLDNNLRFPFDEEHLVEAKLRFL